jgi:mRNA interferase RelE/StbE
MTFEIVVAPDAAQVLRKLPGHVRALVTDTINSHLRHEPTKVSKSRIKRLRGLSQPQYRLRVGDIRVFYDITETTVHVLAIIPKAQAQAWLEEEGRPGPNGGTGPGEG